MTSVPRSLRPRRNVYAPANPSNTLARVPEKDIPESNGAPSLKDSPSLDNILKSNGFSGLNDMPRLRGLSSRKSTPSLNDSPNLDGTPDLAAGPARFGTSDHGALTPNLTPPAQFAPFPAPTVRIPSHEEDPFLNQFPLPPSSTTLGSTALPQRPSTAMMPYRPGPIAPPTPPTRASAISKWRRNARAEKNEVQKAEREKKVEAKKVFSSSLLTSLSRSSHQPSSQTPY